ncbi:MAG: carbon-nitrogen hydrolase family protein [bacterium]
MMKKSIVSILFLSLFASVALADSGWKEYAQRPAIAPEFEQSDEQNILIIKSNGNVSSNGSWRREVPVEAGKHYHFSAEYQAEDVPLPRRSILMKVEWLDQNGRRTAYPEYPTVQYSSSADWQRIEGCYPAPDNARSARVDLIFRWSETGQVHWRNFTCTPVEEPQPRPVSIATINFRPRNSSGPEENLKLFAQYINQAGEQGADIVCLPEGITVVGTQKSYIDVAEPVPGLSTKALGKMAREHEMYIVAGIYEQEGDVVYNTSILLNRQGELQGTYRKVALPREEIEGGITPGDSCPVFETDFGRIGMMICWDVHFPEPARQMGYQGAEIILMPIWGGNEKLFAARAIENQLYLVSSSYDARSGIWDREGEIIAEAKENGSVAVHTVDLNERTLWEWLGDFRARIPREAPLVHEVR